MTNLGFLTEFLVYDSLINLIYLTKKLPYQKLFSCSSFCDVILITFKMYQKLRFHPGRQEFRHNLNKKVSNDMYGVFLNTFEVSAAWEVLMN
jgi:hypothetical protein